MQKHNFYYCEGSVKIDGEEYDLDYFSLKNEEIEIPVTKRLAHRTIELECETFKLSYKNGIIMGVESIYLCSENLKHFSASVIERRVVIDKCVYDAKKSEWLYSSISDWDGHKCETATYRTNSGEYFYVELIDGQAHKMGSYSAEEAASIDAEMAVDVEALKRELLKRNPNLKEE